MGFASLRSHPGFRRPGRQQRHRTTQGGNAPKPAVDALEGRRLLSAAPAIDSLDPSMMFTYEGGSVTLSGAFSDADSEDTAHQVAVDWGDGSETIYLPGAQWQWQPDWNLQVTSGYVNPGNDHAYYLVEGVDWITAEYFAQSLGGHLASITSQEEQDWVYQTFGRSQWGGFEQTVWIGLTDSEFFGAEEGQFKWTSDEPVTYTNWNAATGEPNNAGEEDFASIWAGFGGRWNDSNEFFGNVAVIELDAPVSFPDNGMSRSFQLSHFYADDPADGSTYDVTVQVIDGAGDDSDVETVQAEVQNQPAYLALDDRPVVNEGQLVDFGGSLWDPGADEWTVTVDFGDGTGEQVLHPQAIGRVSFPHAYADEGSYTIHVTWRDDDMEYPLVTDLPVEVLNVAPTLKGLKLSSNTAEEGQEVTLSGLVGDGGAGDVLTLTIDWGDGSADTVLHPAAGAPHPFSASHVYADDGTYNVTVTAEDEDGGSVTRTTGGTLPDGAVSWDAEGGNGHWYGVITLGEPSATAAEARADELDGYLVTITSPEEQQFLNDSFLFADQDGDGYGDDGLYRAYWIGLSDRDVEGSFQWGTGDEALTYENWNWATAEPNDYPWPGGEDYVAMNWHYMMGWFPTEPGLWNDVTNLGDGGMPVQWAIVEFDAAPTPLSVTVSNAAPEVAVSGPATGVRGQSRQFSATVTDPGALDTHTVSWQVLQGTTVVASGAGALAEFTPTETGLYTVRFTAVDDDGGVGAGSSALDVKVVDLQADPDDATKTVLAVGGTTAQDTVVVKPRNGASVEVVLNDVVLGTFAPTGGVHVFGQAGDDHAIVTGSLPAPVTFFGGDGDDLLRSNNAGDLLVGGAGNDRVVGSARSA